MAFSTCTPNRACLRRCSLYSGVIATSVVNADNKYCGTNNTGNSAAFSSSYSHFSRRPISPDFGQAAGANPVWVGAENCRNQPY